MLTIGAPRAHALVLWAQRSSSTDAEKNFVYLTITVPDVPKSSMKLDLKPTGLTFTGHSDTLKKTYHLELEFYAEIDDKASKVNHTGKNVELKLQKKELNEAYWPRLLKEAKKVHFLRTDFDKWVDEDEQNEAAEEDFSQFGGMGKFQSLRLLLQLQKHPLEFSMANAGLLLQAVCPVWVVWVVCDENPKTTLFDIFRLRSLPAHLSRQDLTFHAR